MHIHCRPALRNLYELTFLPPSSPLQVSASIAAHMVELPDLTHAVKLQHMGVAVSRDSLMDAWKAWVEEAGLCVGGGRAGRGSKRQVAGCWGESLVGAEKAWVEGVGVCGGGDEAG